MPWLSLTRSNGKGSAANCSLRIGICGAEPWTRPCAAEIERRLGIEALDSYGLSEVIGPGVAQECAETKDGLTIWEDYFWPEIVDPRKRRGAAGWRAGRTGADVAHQGGDARYPLPHARPDAPAAGQGQRHAADARIKGRSDDMLIIRGVNVFPSQIEAVLGGRTTAGAALPSQGRAARPGSTSSTVLVESRPSLRGPVAPSALAWSGAEHLIKAYVGVTGTVRVVEPESIERRRAKRSGSSIKRPKSDGDLGYEPSDGSEGRAGLAAAHSSRPERGRRAVVGRRRASRQETMATIAGATRCSGCAPGSCLHACRKKPARNAGERRRGRGDPFGGAREPRALPHSVCGAPSMTA